MDGQQILEREFSNVTSMCLQDGMQKVKVGPRFWVARQAASRGTCPPWTGAWTGSEGTPSTASAVCAIVGGISAAQALSGPERTYGKEKVYGSIP